MTGYTTMAMSYDRPGHGSSCNKQVAAALLRTLVHVTRCRGHVTHLSAMISRSTGRVGPSRRSRPNDVDFPISLTIKAINIRIARRNGRIASTSRSTLLNHAPVPDHTSSIIEPARSTSPATYDGEHHPPPDPTIRPSPYRFALPLVRLGRTLPLTPGTQRHLFGSVRRAGWAGNREEFDRVFRTVRFEATTTSIPAPSRSRRAVCHDRNIYPL
jgi:hypothetical protein